MRLEVTSGTLVTVGRALKVEQTVLPELALGPLEVTSLRMNVMDLSQWEKDLGAEIAGLIGMDVLGRTNFRLDYEKRELQFGGEAEEGIAVGCTGGRHGTGSARKADRRHGIRPGGGVRRGLGRTKERDKKWRKHSRDRSGQRD
jgi:hypothetical protein